MIHRIFVKMYSNLRMVSCLLIGVILAVGMMSSIPVYTDGVLQRMLIKDMESFQSTNNVFSGTYNFNMKFIDLKKADAIKKFQQTNNKITKELYPQININSIVNNCRVMDELLGAVDETLMGPNSSPKSITVEAISEFEQHINVIQGKMYSKQKENEIYEAVVSEKTIKEKNLLVGRTYIMKNTYDDSITDYLKVKIVGVYTYKNENDPYWYNGDWELEDSLIIDYDLFMNEFLNETPADLTYADWYYALDYHSITVKGIPSLVDLVKRQTKIIQGTYEYMDVFPVFDILNKYVERAKVLKVSLLVLQIPILLMILFYLFMVSQLIVDQERNEIAVLKSRGYSRLQIVKGYFTQGLILSGIAVLVGPFVGLLFCKFIGASNGFLEFVQRKKLSVFLNLKAYEYSLIAIAFFMITMLVPAILATRNTIVNHKRQSTRKGNSTLWKKLYLDIALLGISIYGNYNYKSRISIIKLADVKGSEIPIDPVLFCISTLFILSMGMIFLRIFPYLVRLVFWLGRKYWGPIGYTSLTNVGRAGAQDQFLMLFLTLTVAIGIFNANSARTININTEQKERYKYGADMVLQPKWDSNKELASTIPQEAADATGSKELSMPKPVIYIEPSYLPYTELKGVDSAAKVFRKEDVSTTVNGKFSKSTCVLGIEPYEFGKTTWFRRDLLPYHINEYLNLMTKDPRAFIVSSTFTKKYNAKVGDPIYVNWGEDNKNLEGYIFAIVDFWPTFNPYTQEQNLESKDLIVANLSYINANMHIEPYEVWLKLKKDATTDMVYKDITEKKLDILAIQNTSQEIITKKNDAMLQGTNGALTMSFIVTIVICTIGYLIYWVLALNKRTLQFGVFRAMGISFKEILSMIIVEQALISGTSIIMGVIAGGLTSDLFISLVQIVYSASEQVIPFKVVAFSGDYLKLYLIVIMMLFIGVIVLGRLISKISINQALRLGED
jgi:putative ABC transport system permease protein